MEEPLSVPCASGASAAADAVVIITGVVDTVAVAGHVSLAEVLPRLVRRYPLLLMALSFRCTIAERKAAASAGVTTLFINISQYCC